MFATLFSASLLSLVAIQGVLADFTVDTPAFTQCQDTQIKWDTTKAPYSVLIVPGENPCSDAIADLGSHNGSSMTWKANVPAGTKVMISVEDAELEEAWSGEITIGASNDTSCLSDADKPPANTTSSAPIPPSTPPPSSNPSSNDNPNPLGGAANAGANPLSDATGAAFSVHQLYTPALALSALGAAFAVAL